MTYVTEQTSAELREHMERITGMSGMPGWHDPLAARLWKEVQALDAKLSEARGLLLEIYKQRGPRNIADRLLPPEKMAALPRHEVFEVDEDPTFLAHRIAKAIVGA